MTHLTQRISTNRILRPQFLSIASITLALLAIQAPTASAQCTPTDECWTANGTHIKNTNTGNVGIGTTTPGTLNGVNFGSNVALHVKGSGGSKYIAVDDSNNVGFLLNDSSQPVNSRMWVLFNQGTRFSVSAFSDAGSPTEMLSVHRNGYVGIGTGTTAPSTRLEVIGSGKFTGNLTVEGNIAAKYQDVAEWVPASEQLPAGTVVVLDPTKSNHVIVSTSEYDTRVAGVISEQPGIALGESGPGKVLVATTGRVRIKVDASRSPIRVGDLLVTSDVSGLAMKSEPIKLGGRLMHMPGTLIGKALEPLEKGSGEILVLLSLQ